MRQLAAFTKKEFTELFRTKKAAVLLTVFAILGIMNPALAKLTPWMLKMMSDAMAQQGIIVGEVAVGAMTSWEQFFKNTPMGLIVVAAMFSGIMANEYQSGTLVNMLAKGLPRWKAVAAKLTAALAGWSVCYWLSFGITYGYNAYFWGNGAALHIGFAAFAPYLFGIWLLALELMFSCCLSFGIYALLATGGVYAVSLGLGAIPALSDYMPTKLSSGLAVMAGIAEPGDYARAAVVAAAMIIISAALSVAGFNRKQI